MGHTHQITVYLESKWLPRETVRVNKIDFYPSFDPKQFAPPQSGLSFLAGWDLAREKRLLYKNVILLARFVD